MVYWVYAVFLWAHWVTLKTLCLGLRSQIKHFLSAVVFTILHTKSLTCCSLRHCCIICDYTSTQYKNVTGPAKTRNVGTWNLTTFSMILFTCSLYYCRCFTNLLYCIVATVIWSSSFVLFAPHVCIVDLWLTSWPMTNKLATSLLVIYIMGYWLVGCLLTAADYSWLATN